jgi:hypothetical protein
MHAYAWFVERQLSTYAPDASHRLIEGVSFYHQVLQRCRAKRDEADRERRAKEASRGR